MSNNPSGNPPRMTGQEFLASGSGAGDGGLQQARSKVNAPAIALMIVAGLAILMALIGVGSSALYVAGVHPMIEQNEQQLDQLREQLGADSALFQLFEQISKVSQGPAGLVMNLVALAASLLMLIGAIKMKGLKSYPLALGATVVAILPISSCCCVGLPIGIWGLIALMDSNVKQNFQ